MKKKVNMKYKILSLVLGLVLLPGLLLAGAITGGIEYTYDQVPTDDSEWIQAEGSFAEGAEFTVYLDQSKGADWVHFRLTGEYNGNYGDLKFTHPDYDLDDEDNSWGLGNNSDVVFWITEDDGVEDRFCKFARTTENGLCSNNDKNYLRTRADFTLDDSYLDYGEVVFTEKNDNYGNITVNVQKLADKPEEPQNTGGGGISLTQRLYDKHGKVVAHQMFDLMREHAGSESETKFHYWKRQNKINFVEQVGSSVEGITSWKTIETIYLPDMEE